MPKSRNTLNLKRRLRAAIPREPRHLLRLVLAGLGSLVVFSLGVLVAWTALLSIPSIDNFQNRIVSESTKIYDRTGSVLLYDVHGAMRRTHVPLSAISKQSQDAAIAIEDADFYNHSGVRPTALLRAVLVDLGLREGYAGQGGSTITQQVVKNTLLTSDKSFTRKIKEIILALKLERVYTKDQILETYLNEIPYGGTVYGIEEASKYFFGVSAKDVDLAESAYLAALPQAPTRYSPYGTHRNELEARKNLVLQKMKDNGYITDAEYAAAKSEKVEFRSESEAGIKAPHFVFYVREYLEQKYGADAVANGGLQVVTTLDYDLQKKAEDIVARRVPQMERDFDASNAGLVGIDPTTGQILTMVGSRGYFDEKIDGKYNIALAERQPGSSFKPFVYATALTKGYTPSTVVFDLKTQFSTACAPDDMSDEPPCYSPENFDGKFKGPLTFRDALAQSVNIVAVKALYLAGIQDSITMAENLGVTTLASASRYGLTLVLGGGEVNLLEMTGAYSVFANDGVRNPPTGILKVTDRDGNVLEEYQPQPSRVLDAEVAREMNDMLSDNVARTPEFGANSPLYFPGLNVADKTGTTNDYHDVWVLGYTPSFAAGAWAGNNDNTPMQKKIAAFIIAPMWHEFMVYALSKYPGGDFVPPAPETSDSLPPVLKGNWNTDASKGIHDILFWADKDNPHQAPTNPWSDSQFARWEYPVSLWASQNPDQYAVPGPVSPFPGINLPIAPVAAAATSFSITNPRQGSVIPSGQLLTFTVAHTRPETVTRVAYYLNGTYLGASTQAPFSLSVMPTFRGQASIRAVAESQNYGTIEQTTIFTIK